MRSSFAHFGVDNGLKLSASLAYYTVFSLPPMILIIITSAGFIWGREAIQGEVYREISNLVGSSTALQIQETIKHISLSGETKLATTIGVITLIIGATGVFSEIQDSINTIWGLKAKPKKGLLRFLVNRLLSFSMVITMGFLLMVSLVISAVLAAFGARIEEYFPEVTVYVILIINQIITFLVITLLFATIFKVLPDAKIRWRDVFVGAITTAILFMLGKAAIGFYLGKTAVESTYGAAGSIIILLVWVYYSSIILYFGAEFTHIYAFRYGGRISPNRYAVWVEHKEIEKRPDFQPNASSERQVEDK